MTLDPLIVDLVLLLFALLFGASGAVKLIDRRRFVGVLAAYRLLPGGKGVVLALASWLLPFLELGAAALAIAAIASGLAPLALVAVGTLVALMLSAYALAMAVNLMRGRSRIDCGCLGFGARGRRIRWAMVGRNLLLAAISLLVATSPVVARPLGPLDLVTLVMATVVFILLYGALEVAFANQDAAQELEAMR